MASSVAACLPEDEDPHAPEDPAVHPSALLAPDCAVLIFGQLAPPDAAAACCVCSAWRALASSPAVWEAVHAKTWPHGAAEQPDSDDGSSHEWRAKVQRRVELDAELLAVLRPDGLPPGNDSELRASRQRINDAAMRLVEQHGFPTFQDALTREARGTGFRLPRAPPLRDGDRPVVYALYKLAYSTHHLRLLPGITQRPGSQSEDVALGLARALHGTTVDVDWVPGVLDRLGAEVRRRMDARGARVGQMGALHVLHEVLFGRPADGARGCSAELRRGGPAPRLGGLGLTGNTGEYYSLHNSLIDSVLKTGLGLPITLCIIHAAVARRAGLAVRVLNTPAHVLNHHGARRSSSECFIDCFDPTPRQDGSPFMTADAARRLLYHKRRNTGMLSSKALRQELHPAFTARRMLSNLRMAMLSCSAQSMSMSTFVMEQPLWSHVFSLMGVITSLCDDPL